MYSEKDFSKCLFNPCVVDMFVEYSQLEKVQAINKKIDNKLMKYIVCVYDYRSPIAESNRDLRIRKQVAAEFVGYDLKKDEVLKSIFDLSEDYVLQAVDMFLKSFIHNRVWYMICCNENIFYEYGQRMFTPVSNQEGSKAMSEKDITAAMALKTELSDDMAKIDERLETAYKRLYGNESMDKFISGATTPESIAFDRAKNVRKN